MTKHSFISLMTLQLWFTHTHVYGSWGTWVATDRFIALTTAYKTHNICRIVLSTHYFSNGWLMMHVCPVDTVVIFGFIILFILILEVLTYVHNPIIKIGYWLLTWLILNIEWTKSNSCPIHPILKYYLRKLQQTNRNDIENRMKKG